MRGTFTPYSGVTHLLFAFQAAVIGGTASIRGTIIGGIILGLSQTLAAQVHPQGFLIGGNLVFFAVLFARLRFGTISLPAFKAGEGGNMRFAGKSVFVSGGASGIGRAASLGFAREGAKVLIADIDERSRATVAEIISAGGVAYFQLCDVRDAGQVNAAVAEAINRHGGLHAAFNNAGILPEAEPLHEISAEAFERVMAVDVKGVFNCLQAQIRAFLVSGGGAIVNTPR